MGVLCICMFVGVHGSIGMAVLVRMSMAEGVFVVQLLVFGGFIAGQHVNLRSGDPAAAHFAHLETGANVQGGRSFFKQFEGHACIDECAEQHVAANAGKAFQISNTH